MCVFFALSLSDVAVGNYRVDCRCRVNRCLCKTMEITWRHCECCGATRTLSVPATWKFNANFEIDLNIIELAAYRSCSSRAAPYVELLWTGSEEMSTSIRMISRSHMVNWMFVAKYLIFKQRSVIWSVERACERNDRKIRCELDLQRNLWTRRWFWFCAFFTQIQIAYLILFMSVASIGRLVCIGTALNSNRHQRESDVCNLKCIYLLDFVP